jgi:hypothetical protein
MVRRKLSGLVLVLVLLALLAPTAAKTPDSGGDEIVDAPVEAVLEEANVSIDSGVSRGLGEWGGANLETPKVAFASKVQILDAGSDMPPISVLLNRQVWFDIEDRSLDGSGPYGKLVVNRLPVGSPDFNRLLERAGYAKAREFDKRAESWSWWEDPRVPKLPYSEDDRDLDANTFDVKRFYVGWAYSKTYHYPDCIWSKNIPTGSQVWFSSPEEAKAKGFAPCTTCNPP